MLQKPCEMRDEYIDRVDAHNEFEKKVVFKVDTAMKYTHTTKERIERAQKHY